MSASPLAPGSRCGLRARGARPIDRRPTEREPDTFVSSPPEEWGDTDTAVGEASVDVQEDTSVGEVVEPELEPGAHTDDESAASIEAGAAEPDAAEPDAAEPDAAEPGRDHTAEIAVLEQANAELRALLSEAERYNREAAVAREVELVRLRRELSARGGELDELRLELADAADEREQLETDLAARREELTALRAQLDAAQELACTVRSELVAAQMRHAAELEDLRKEHEQAMNTDYERFDAELSAMERQYEAELTELERRSESELAMLLATHERELADLRAKRREEIDAADKRAAAALALQYLLFSQMWR